MTDIIEDLKYYAGQTGLLLLLGMAGLVYVIVRVSIWLIPYVLFGLLLLWILKDSGALC